MRQRLHKSEAGLTLVEILVASIFVGSVGMTLLSFIVSIREVSNFARRETQATLAAEDKLEQLRSTPFNSAPLVAGSVDFTAEMPSDLITPNADYTVTNLTSTLKQIDITISYRDDEVTRSHSFRSYISNPGITQ